jgi:protein ImuB
MLWCALHLHLLPLEVFQRTVTENSNHLPIGLQLAVCDRHTVLLASHVAQSLGVHSGIKRATALALAPDIVLLDRNIDKEQAALSQVATWALQFTPSVSLEAQGLVMEIEPSLRLFKGLDHLIILIKSGLNELGFSAQVACATTPLGACLLAQYRDGIVADQPSLLNRHLSELPLSLFPKASQHLTALQAIGAHTLKDIVQLPRAGLSRRFGKDVIDEIDKALGKTPDLRGYFEAPLEFHSKLELMAQVENAEALLFAARRMLVELTGWLGARHCAVKSFILIAEHDDRGPKLSTPTVLEIHLSEPNRELARLSDLLREKLNVFKLRAPAHTLQLHCTDVHILPSATGHLFMLPQTAQQNLGRLVEKLQARLGANQVQQIKLNADYRPESAFVFQDFEVTTHKAAAAKEPDAAYLATPQAHSLPRPLWLLATPQPLQERNQRPFWQGALQLLAGPERIEGGWWDNHFIQRDYFIAEDTQNNLYWIYRERGNHKQNIDPGWFMQGRFG